MPRAREHIIALLGQYADTQSAIAVLEDNIEEVRDGVVIAARRSAERPHRLQSGLPSKRSAIVSDSLFDELEPEFLVDEDDEHDQTERMTPEEWLKKEEEALKAMEAEVAELRKQVGAVERRGISWTDRCFMVHREHLSLLLHARPYRHASTRRAHPLAQRFRLPPTGPGSPHHRLRLSWLCVQLPPARASNRVRARAHWQQLLADRRNSRGPQWLVRARARTGRRHSQHADWLAVRPANWPCPSRTYRLRITRRLQAPAGWKCRVRRACPRRHSACPRDEQLRPLYLARRRATRLVRQALADRLASRPLPPRGPP